MTFDGRSICDPEFLPEIQRWIEQDGEILAEVRYHASAGKRDWILVDSTDEFSRYITILKPMVLDLEAGHEGRHTFTETLDDLLEVLYDFQGRLVLVCPEPDCRGTDLNVSFDATVPGPDGVVRRGTY